VLELSDITILMVFTSNIIKNLSKNNIDLLSYVQARVENDTPNERIEGFETVHSDDFKEPLYEYYSFLVFDSSHIRFAL